MKKLGKNSKILVTGHKGLVGSAIVRRLKFFGYKNTFQIKKKKNISYIVKKCLKFKKSSMIIINCDKGHRKSYRPPTT